MSEAIPLIRPFGNCFVLFGIPPGLPMPAGCARGEELADLEAQLEAADDERELRSLGITT